MGFGELLRATLKENRIPVSRLAESIGYNRVAIYSVFKGEKKLPEQVFEEILGKFDIPASQQASLRREYYNDNIDENTGECIRFFLSELATIGEEPSTMMLPQRELDISKGGVFLAGLVDYYSGIRTFLENESHESGTVVYTNYSFFDEQADKIVYDYIKEKNRDDILVHHRVRPNSITPMKEKIRNLCAAVKFARLGHIMSVADDSVNDYAFSTFFIGKKTILLYDNTNEFGFLSTEETTVAAYILAAIKREPEGTTLTRFSNDPFELKSILRPYQINIHSSFDSDFPLHCFTTFDILDNTLKKDIPNREMVLSACWGHIEYCSEIRSSIITSQRGLTRFFENGKASDASDSILNRVSFEDKRKAFINCKNRLSDPEFRFSVLNSDLVPIASGFSVEVYENGVLFALDAKYRSDGDYIGAAFLIVMDSELSAVFKALPEYLAVNGYLLPDTLVADILDGLIDQCDAVIKAGS